MKKLFFSVLISLFLPVSVLAASSITVASPDIFAVQGDTITVPVNFTGNNGIMGAKLSFYFPDGVLELKDISSGSVTENGLFNTTVTDYYSVKDRFDVIWSSSENFYDDGSFVLLTFKVNENASNGEYKIAVSFSQSDTFDESWNDVKLDCHDIIINVSDGTFDTTKPEVTASLTDESVLQTEAQSMKNVVSDSVETISTENETPQLQGETQPVVSDDYMISSVELIANSFGLTDIEKASEEQANSLLEFVNNRLEMYNEEVKRFESFNELKDAYDKSVMNKSVSDIILTVDEDVITSIGDEVKSKYGVKLFTAISPEKKEQAVSEFIEKLNAAGADTVVLQKVENPNKAADIADNVLKAADEQFENSEYIGQSDSKSSIIVASVSAAVIFTLVVIGITVVIKRKKVAGGNKK